MNSGCSEKKAESLEQLKKREGMLIYILYIHIHTYIHLHMLTYIHTDT